MFENCIMYKLNTHNCCLCQINYCCRYPVYCQDYAEQYVKSGFPVEKVEPVNRESYSRNQNNIFKSRQNRDKSVNKVSMLNQIKAVKIFVESLTEMLQKPFTIFPWNV